MRPDALERVIAATASDVLRYFERRLPERADAADCLSEVLLVLWRDRDRVPDDPHEARLWMFGIARTTLTATRRIAARRAAEVERLRLALDTVVHPETTSATDLTLDVRSAIAALPAAQREVVQLHHWEGLPLVDIANVVGVPASTVRSRYAAARLALATALSAHQVDA
ncbi:MAG: RNA polymerase sigma factor [Actinomycetes bacterium]